MKFTIEMNPFAARGFCDKYGSDSKTHVIIAEQLREQLPVFLAVGDIVVKVGTAARYTLIAIVEDGWGVIRYVNPAFGLVQPELYPLADLRKAKA